MIFQKSVSKSATGPQILPSGNSKIRIFTLSQLINMKKQTDFPHILATRVKVSSFNLSFIVIYKLINKQQLFFDKIIILTINNKNIIFNFWKTTTFINNEKTLKIIYGKHKLQFLTIRIIKHYCNFFWYI